MNLRAKYDNLALPVKAALWFTVSNALVRGVNFLTMPFLTRIMPDTEYGILTVYNSWLSILLAIVALNIYGGCFNAAMAKYDTKRERLLASSYLLILTLAAAAFLVFLFAKEPLGDLLSLNSALVVAIPVNIFATAEFALWTAYQRFVYDYKKLLAATALFIIVPAVVSILCAWMWPVADQKAIAKVVSQLCVSVPIVVVLGVTVLKKAETKLDPSIWKYLLSFAIPLLPHYLSMMLLGQSDRVIINYLCGPEQAAYYAVAYQISVASTIIITAISSAVVPWLYNLLKTKDVAEAPSKIRIVSIIVAGINFVIALASPEIIAIFAPESYREAALLIPVIASSTYCSYLYSMCINIELYYQKKIYTVVISIIATVINIALNLALIPEYGYGVAAYTTLGCYVLMGIGHTIAARKIGAGAGVGDILGTVSLWVIGIVLIVLDQAIIPIFEYPIIRYGIVLIVFGILFIFRKQVIEFFKMTKKPSKEEN